MHGEGVTSRRDTSGESETVSKWWFMERSKLGSLRKGYCKETGQQAYACRPRCAALGYPDFNISFQIVSRVSSPFRMLVNTILSPFVGETVILETPKIR
jgi:hypothetical protein